MNFKEQPVLAIARHGESILNSQGRWSGRLESPLTFNGYIQATSIARAISHIEIDTVFTSTSERTKTTWTIMQGVLGLSEVSIVNSPGLLERDIGLFAGLKYEEIKARFNLTTDELETIRLDYWANSPGGETRAQVYDRVSAVYDEEILPRMVNGQNIVVVGHNISTSALMMRVESRPHTDMNMLEIERAQAVSYTMDRKSKMPVMKSNLR